MLKNYIKVAFRSFWKSKLFTAVYIIGLTLGMSCFLFILLWVKDERSFDNFHTKVKNIYQVKENQYWGDVKTSDAVPWPLANALKADVKEISKATLITANDVALFNYKDKLGKENGVYGYPALFEIFDFPILEGDYRQLSFPNSIIISKKLATKYFPDESPVGKIFKINNNLNYSVCAVMKDIPHNSSIQFDYVLPGQVFESQNNWLNWGNHSFRTYVLLNDKTNIESVNERIKHFLKTKNSGSKEDLFLQKFSEVYLYSNFSNGKPAGGRIDYVKLFSTIAFLVLLIACTNFMNLTTARSTKRAKEVGIRKVIGAKEGALTLQFLCEAILISLISILISVALVRFLLPFFNDVTGKTITFEFYRPIFIGGFLSLAVITGLLSGIYPSFFLSHLKPVRILKNSTPLMPGGVNLRKSLVVFQFLVSIILISATFIIHRQINYIKEKNLGINKINVIYLNLEGVIGRQFETFRQSLIGSPGIKSICASGQLPISVEGYSSDPDWDGKKPGEMTTFTGLSVSYDFLTTMKIPLLGGRDFSRSFISDSSNYILNETALKAMRLTNPIGKRMTFWKGKGTIVGVIKDFHFSSLHNPVQPMILLLGKDFTDGYGLIEIEGSKIQPAIAAISSKWKQFNPDYVLDYHFLDGEFESQYKSETVVGYLANYFAFMAIFISCLGLFGLSVYDTQLRLKEIGIRKVLGASSFAIVYLILKDSLKLILISICIAIPISWWAINIWLQNFAYHTSINLMIFIAIATFSLIIALVTVSAQVLKAAISNPVDSMRNR